MRGSWQKKSSEQWGCEQFIILGALHCNIKPTRFDAMLRKHPESSAFRPDTAAFRAHYPADAKPKMTTLQVNGKPLQIDVPDDMPLLWAPVAIKPATRRLLPVHTCPPSPNWHLAPKEMVWVGATPRDICLRLRDPETNGR